MTSLDAAKEEITRLTKVNHKLESENFNFRKENLTQKIELLTLKEDDYSHISINSIDDDGLDVLDRMHRSLGEDGLKHWLLKLFPKPEIEYKQPKIRMLSEVMKELNLPSK